MVKSRSEETRGRILEAARTRFASQGYRNTTIRAIAADAQIDPSMVMRYYGSKDELFEAVLDPLLELPSLVDVHKSRRGAALAVHIIDRWERHPKADVLLTLLRSVTVDESVAARMRAIFEAELVPVIASAVDDPEEAPARAGLIATQVLGFALCCHLLRLPPVAQMNESMIIRHLGDTIQRYLTRPL
jgi:AcrR family transcriptional regulator